MASRDIGCISSVVEETIKEEEKGGGVKEEMEDEEGGGGAGGGGGGGPCIRFHDFHASLPVPNCMPLVTITICAHPYTHTHTLPHPRHIPESPGGHYRGPPEMGGFVTAHLHLRQIHLAQGPYRHTYTDLATLQDRNRGEQRREERQGGGGVEERRGER